MNEFQKRLIPCYMWSKFRCCVIYDGHPRDKKKIDVTVCLEGGIVREVFERLPVASINIPNVTGFNKIEIIRNDRGDLYYLIETGQELIILSSTDQLSIHRRYFDVKHYEICDHECSGEAQLKIQFQSSVKYISFSDIQEDSRRSQRVINSSDYTCSILFAFERKISEAKYALRRNEEAYKLIKKLRQWAILDCHEDGALTLKTTKPIVLFCNKKIIIQLEVENKNFMLIKNVCVLIHNTSCNSIKNTTKVYKYLSTCPFYEEIQIREIDSQCKASIVTVIPISEFKSTRSGRIDFSVIVSYEMSDKQYLQYFDNVHISVADVMGKNFDVFSNSGIDDRTMCIAVLSTTTKTKLCLKQKGLSNIVLLSKIFGDNLKMDILAEGKIAIHRHSPHHILHGMLIVFDDNQKDVNIRQEEINYNIDVFTRSPSQVMALIDFINDTVEPTLIALSPNTQVTSYGQDSTMVSDGNIVDKPFYDFRDSAKSFQEQASITLSYMDDCLKKMYESKKVGNTDFKIDLLALGPERFLEYKNRMVAEAKNGFEHFMKSKETSYVEDIMEIDYVRKT